jgi:Sigma-70 region 2
VRGMPGWVNCEADLETTRDAVDVPAQASHDGMYVEPAAHIGRLTRKGMGNRKSDESWRKHFSDFENRFSQNRPLIAFVARRVLDSQEQAEAAVKECFETASRNPPVFTKDGAFRSWILRMVIEEALLIFSRKGDCDTAPYRVLTK